MTNDKDITARVIRSNRKTLAIEISRSGILIRAPYSVKNDEIASFLNEKKEWIKKHLDKIAEQKEKLQDIKPYTMEEIQALADKALKIIPERVRYYAPLIGVTYGHITIRNQRSRWGSCSGKGNLNFNCLLMEMPDEIIDSVVVHELCHRKHMNHSAAFYKEIERVFPKYNECNSWLKQNGGAFLNRLP